MFGSNRVRKTENKYRERTLVYFEQLAHRGRGEKKKQKERKIGVKWSYIEHSSEWSERFT